jgi:hypothetical protein
MRRGSFPMTFQADQGKVEREARILGDGELVTDILWETDGKL